MEVEKIQKQKPHTSFNRQLSVAKNPEGTWQQPRKMLKILFYKGEHNKGGKWQRVLRYILNIFIIQNYLNNDKEIEFTLYSLEMT